MANVYRPPSAGPGPRWRWVGAGVLLVVFSIFLLIREKGQHPAVLGPQEPELVLTSSGTIGVGGSVQRALAAAGLSPLESVQVEKTLRPVFNPRRAQATDRYSVYRSSGGHFGRLEYWPNPFKYFQVDREADGRYTSATKEVPLEESRVGVSGEITVSLWDSMIRQEVPPEMIYRFAELFGWRIDFLTEPRKGDTYKMIWKRMSGNGARRDSDILYAYYHNRDKGDLYAIPFKDDYFDAEGDSLRGDFLRAPLAYRRISSRFTHNRFHPVLRYWRPHHGIDYSAARGTPVVSIGDGVVTAKGYRGGLGNEVRVRHAGSYVSIYGHLMGFARGIRVGGHVKQGQVVGYVGSTGLSTGPHLHFGFEQGGRLVNFLGMKSKSNRKRIAAADRPAFQAAVQESMAKLAALQTSGTLQTIP